MITPENITRREARKLIELLERTTRCEIMARFGRFDNLEFMDYAMKQIEYQQQIRKMVFDEPDLYELGKRWGMIHEPTRRKKLRKRRT